METFLELSLILSVATLIAFIMQSLRLPLMLGYLLTGILVGPIGLNLLHSSSTIEIFSQLGITALLFIVGLNLNPRVIRDVGRVSLIVGVGQILLTALLGYLVVRVLNIPSPSAWYVTGALTFSSTIIVLKLLSDRRDLGKLYGKIVTGVLLIQDVVALIILLGISTMGHGALTMGSVSLLLTKTLLLAVIVGVMAFLFLPRLSALFSRSQEFLFIFSIGWGMGLAALFYVFGLSIEIGALVAGVTLASSPYHYEISAKMKLLRDFFIILFFVLLGAKFQIGSSTADLLLPAIVLSLFVLVVKPLIVMFFLGRCSYTKKVGFYSGISLSQISEFSYILLLAGLSLGHISDQAASLITLVGLITMSVSTLLILCVDRIYPRLSGILSIFERPRPRRETRRRESFDALLLGCHRVGSDFIPTLHRLGLRFLVVDFDPMVIEQLKQRGIPCRYGDANDNEFLDELNVSKLRLVISTLPDVESNLFILSKIKKENRRAVIITTAQALEEAQALYAEGSSYVILPHYLGGNHAAALMEQIGVDPKRFAHERKQHLLHLEHRTNTS